MGWRGEFRALIALVYVFQVGRAAIDDSRTPPSRTKCFVQQASAFRGWGFDDSVYQPGGSGVTEPVGYERDDER